MNKKHKLKRIKWGALITISCLIGVILLNTSAKSLSNSKAKVKKLTETKASCKVYKNSDFNPKITISKPENERKVKVDVSIKKNIDANFWIFISDGEDMEGQITFKTENKFKGKDGYHGDYDIELPIVESYVVIVYKDGIEGACGTTNQTTAKNIAIDYIKNKKFSNSMETTISNQAIIAKGAYQIIEMSVDEPIEEDDSGNTTEENDIIKEIEGISSESGSTSGNIGEATLVDDPKNLPDGDLSCSLNTPYKEGITEGDNYYTNNKSYYHSETTKKDYCEKTCEETITIKYGPPVATKAGMCFEYKVKVESKVSCKTKWLGDNLKPTKKKLCTIYPSCNGSATYGDQAGPDTDFDSCVNKCDNGKYSQKCINKCYKEVYENVDNKKISYDNSTNDNASGSLLATRTALSDLGINLSTKFCQSDANDPTYYKSNYDQLMTAMRDKNNGCEYKETKDGTIYWSCSSAHSSINNSKYWQALGRYYFLTDSKAQQTLKSISGSCQGEPRGDKHYRYYIDADGFKRATFGGDRHCTQTCTWKKSSKSPSDCVVSKSKRDKEYKDALEKYRNLKAACKAEASCSTKTATFTISVDNKVATKYNETGKVTETKNNRDEFTATINGGKITSTTKVNPIIDSGACYGASTGDYNYMTEWTFPGSWRNNKNGEISQDDKNGTTGWSQRKNYYCTSLDSVGVNSNWWNWAQYTKLKDKTSYANSSIKYNGTSDSIDYNITATTNNFGHFGWNVTMKCFYATPSSDETTTPPSECEGEDGCDTKDETPKFEYEARSVDTKEMFPEESRGSGEEQIIGFNWTNKANENLEVDTSKEVTINGEKKTPISYEIKPEELKENIKKQAEDGKTYSDDNLEYYVQLDRKALKELKGMTIGKFDGTFESYAVGKEGVKLYTIQRYKTNLIDNYGGTRRRTILCNNWDNGNCRTYS